MDNNFKYWLEDNKDKLYIAGAVVALLGIVTGGYYLTNKERINNTADEIEYTMADYVLSQTQDGAIELYETSKGELLDSLTSSEEAITFTGDSLDTAYLYAGDTVSVINVEDESIVLGEEIPIGEVKGVLNVQTNGDKFGFLTEDELVVFNAEGESVLVYDDNPTGVFHVTDEGMYMSVDNEIHYIEYDSGETEYIDIGDVTTKFSQHGGSIIARNNFGSGENTESILNIEEDSLFINNLKRVQHENKIDLNVPSNENHISMIQYTKSSSDKITKQELVSVAIDNTHSDSESENLVRSEDFTVELDSLEAFTPQAKLAKGYIYDNADNQLRIIEMNNGREAKRFELPESINYMLKFK